MDQHLPPVIQIGDVLVSMDIVTEKFCCDYEKCKGQCCIDGDSGAPVTMDEIALMEESLDEVWHDLSPQAQSVIDRQGVAYVAKDGDLAASIVGCRDCVFTCYDGDYCLCALERAYRQGKTHFKKPISCSLYPIREVHLSDGTIGLNYHKWDICKDAVAKGEKEDIPVYKFLKEPLSERFGKDWYNALVQAVDMLKTLSTDILNAATEEE